MPSSTGVSNNVTEVINVNSTDDVQLMVYQNSGAALDITAAHMEIIIWHAGGPPMYNNATPTLIISIFMVNCKVDNQ